MKEEDALLSVGYDRKYGGFDFSVRCSVEELTYEQMKEFREMIIVAIWQAEEMWRIKIEKGDSPKEISPQNADKQKELKPQ